MRDRVRVRRGKVAGSVPARARRSNDEVTDVVDLRAAEATVQTKLKVGAAGDRYEREADRVAAAVLRQLEGGGAAPKEGTPSRDAAVGRAGGEVRGETARAVDEARGGGRKLPEDVRREMEDALGADLRAVRLHDDAKAQRAAADLSARAFTTGSDVFLGAGESAPRSRRGKALLAHELTHVVQQGAAPEAEGTVQRVLGTTTVGTAKGAGNPFEEGTDEAIPNEFVELADAIQSTSMMLGGDANPETFSSTSAGAPTTGLLTTAGGLKKMGAGAISLGEGIKSLKRGKGAKGTSLDSNLGGMQVESGVNNLLAGGAGTSAGVTKIVGKAGELPGFDVAQNFIEGTIKTKKAIEDSVAAEKLRHEGRRAKHDTDHHLPMPLRVQRLTAFHDDYKEWKRLLAEAEDHAQKAGVESTAAEKARAAKQTARTDMRSETDETKKQELEKTYERRKARQGRRELRAEQHVAEKDRLEAEAKAIERRFKSGDVERFEKAIADHNAGADLDPADYEDFLEKLAANRVKEFGKGTEIRKQYDQDVKDGTETATTDYEQSRGLKKVTKFGRRRKAEMATIGAVEATGHFLDGAGTLTAAGDMGATKLAGKSLKAGSALYKGVKGIAKRAKRVHNLRTAKNDLSYGGKDDRGVGWGIKQFFGGNVEGSQKKVKGSMAGKGGKSVDTTGKSPEELAAIKKKLTLQAIRRVGDLIDCLGSKNDQIFERACAILHVIAETNAGGLANKIDDNDLQRFRRLHQKAKDTSNPPAQSVTDRYKQQRKVIKTIFTMQLQGVGG